MYYVLIKCYPPWSQTVIDSSIATADKWNQMSDHWLWIPFYASFWAGGSGFKKWIVLYFSASSLCEHSVDFLEKRKSLFHLSFDFVSRRFTFHKSLPKLESGNHFTGLWLALVMLYKGGKILDFSKSCWCSRNCNWLQRISIYQFQKNLNRLFEPVTTA